MLKTNTILLIIVISSLLTAVSGVVGGFPLSFLEPVFCIQMIGAACPPFAISWFSLVVDFAFWTVVATIGFAGLRIVLGAKSEQAETRQNSENKREPFPIQPLPKQVSPFKLLTALKNKLLIIGIVVTILLVLTVGLAGYLVYRNYQPGKEVPKTQPTPTLSLPSEPISPIENESEPDANWARYENWEIGFSFKHPDLEITLCSEQPHGCGLGLGSADFEEVLLARYRVAPGQFPSFFGVLVTKGVGVVGEDFGTFVKKQEQILLETLQNYRRALGEDIVGNERMFSVNVGGRKGYVLEGYSIEEGPWRRYYLPLAHSGKVLAITVRDRTFDQILSTFKFSGYIQTDKASGWKIYRNEEHGFMFRLPNFNYSYSCCEISGPLSEKAERIIVLADKSTILEGTDKPFNGFAVYIEPNTDEKSFSKYIEGQKEGLLKNYYSMAMDMGVEVEPNPVESSILVGGQKGILLKDYAWWADMIYTPPPNSNKILIIAKTEESKGSFDVVFNQILSTFRFID